MFGKVKEFAGNHKLPITIVAISAFLVILIVVIIGGGADDCDTDSGGASGNWQWPFDGVNDPPQYGDGGQFGTSAASAAYRNGHTFHDGFDWSFGMNGVHSGSTVKAVHDGTVKTVGYAAGLDEYVWVTSDDGYNEVYQETFDKSDIKVKEGDHVNAGDEIGTAHLNGHMHLGITKESDFAKAESKAFTDDGTWLDPIKTIEEGMKHGSSSSGSSKGGKSTGAGGAWTQKGTVAYKTAKGLFDAWVKQGCSGAAASGIVGFITGEGGDFSIPDRAEGHNGNGRDAEIAYGAVPTPVGPGYSVGGGGVYQLTPYTGFAKVGDKKWLDVGKQTEYFVKVKLPGWNPAYGIGIHPKSFKEFAHLTDPKKACDAWNCAEIGNAGNVQGREANAVTAYNMFGGKNIKANDAALDAGAAASSTGAAGSDSSSDCTDGSDSMSAGNGDILATAKSLLGYFHYGQVHGESNIGSVDHPNKDGVTDCSGFVWLVLTKAGYNTPDNMGWFTGSMAADATGPQKYLKKIDEKDAKAGDILICNQGGGSGNNGHTAILEEKWKGGDTKIIQEGGTGGSGGVNESTVSQSFGDLFTNGQVTLARAVKK